ncbi:MAG: ribonuclease H-like domain-containing protein [Methanomassiliicoccales archaeon]
MLRNSHIIFTGIGKAKERKLWNEGILDWEDLENKGADKRPELKKEIEKAIERLSERDASYFAAKLPASERWRLLPDFISGAAFVDVEVMMPAHLSPPFIIGVYARGKYVGHVEGVDNKMEEIGSMINQAELLVSFNGSVHDIPAIRRRMVLPACPFIDLRHICKRAGIEGGLEDAERIVGIGRTKSTRYIARGNTNYLWKLYRRNGNRRALELLLEYNRYDTCNMLPLSIHLMNHFVSKCGLPYAGI